MSMDLFVGDALNGFATTTGLTGADVVNWTSEKIAIAWISSGFAVLKYLAPLLVAFTIFSFLIHFSPKYLKYIGVIKK